jgi:3-methyladenine DNA glycosylase AlkD
MEAYMRNKFEFYGIMAKERKAIARPFLTKAERPPLKDLEKTILALWREPHREVQLIAMELLDKYKRELTAEYFALLEKMISTKSWWDTVDYIASTLVGNLVRRFPEEGYKWIDKWRKSGDIWLVRTTIIFQLKYKEEVDEELLFSLIKENRDDKEFFIRKAIGWSLRQYGKYKPERIRWFIENNELSGLSRREAMKNLG